MSFKREGNDTGLLANLRKRRIKELLAEEVPEEEAKLLCNGRFACLVCSHRPIFDTVIMLSVHRKGKKHAASEVIFLQKKKELKHLIFKRQHEQFMKDGTTNIRQAIPSTSGGLGTAEPYDPRVKKHKLKPYDRKPRVELSESGLDDDPMTISSSAAQVLASGTPLRHGHQLKNIFRPGTSGEESAPVQPYQSKRNRQPNTASGSYSAPFNSTAHPQEG